MIISFPTALYDAILPKEEDSGNVTFTISSNDPPRSTETFFQLFGSEELRPLPDRIFTRAERRLNLGELIFQVATGTQSVVADGAKVFEVGQVLDFEDITEPSNVTQLEVPEVIELQQNTNLLNLESLGLTEDEASLLVSDANSKLDDSINRFNNTKTAISDKEAQIEDNQRLSNEVRKAKDAASAVFAGSTDPTAGNTIIDKLDAREQELAVERTALIEELNALNALAGEIYNEILDIREVVR